LSISRTTERAKRFGIANDQRFLLGAGPALELGFALAGFGKTPEDFDAQQSNRRIEFRCAASPTKPMIY
jgi:hypothetical protein